MKDGMSLHIAIVLQQKTDYRFVVFSRDHGLHDVICWHRQAQRISRGAAVSCDGTWLRQRLYASDVTLCAQPAQWAYHNIWFLHHVVDLLLACLCYTQPEPAVFALITRLYQAINCDAEHLQVIFLVRLFFLLGIQPENILHLKSLMQYVAHHSFEELVDDHAYTLHELYTWLHHCVAMCEEYTVLQTKAFYEMRGV